MSRRISTQLKSAGVKTIGRYYDRAYGSGIGEVLLPPSVEDPDQGRADRDRERGPVGLRGVPALRRAVRELRSAKQGNRRQGPQGRRGRRASGAGARPARRDADLFRDRFRSDARPGQPASRRPHLAEHRSLFRSGQRGVGADIAGRSASMAPGSPASVSRRAARRNISGCRSSLGHVGSPEFFNGGQWHLFQNVIEIKRSYARDTFDTDVVNPAAPYFGQWTSRGAGDAAQRRCRGGNPGEPRLREKGMRGGDRAGQRQAASRAKTARYNSTCRILTDEDRGYVGVEPDRGRCRGRLRPHMPISFWGDCLEICRGQARANRCFPPPTAAAPKPGTAGLGIPTQRVSER